ncbi:hypothetical protein MTBUT4_210056 [Magnetospirillum sp. UT-4]|nr:hypothetical protein MTBUT4_210056 [Magnetospirillum sp. UT-4]
MLGPAELREINEALSLETSENTRGERRSPYITPQFGIGLAVTRAAASGLRPPFGPLAPAR